MEKVNKTDKEWREILSEEEFIVTRKKGTERAFTGKYYKNEETGKYLCICCGNELFNSEHKYESGSGWPSFFLPVNEENIKTETDLSHFMRRTEVNCAKCGAHLGHVFDDGPKPTGKRFCINSVSLKFEKK